MANKITNFSGLIQRVTSSCLLNPLLQVQQTPDHHPLNLHPAQCDTSEDEEEEEFEECKEQEQLKKLQKSKKDFKKLLETEAVMLEMFDSVSDLKKAYISLQKAHSPWDPVKMSVADMAVVKELKRIGRLKERFNRRRRSGGGLGGFKGLSEAVAPYEETVDELKKEVKAKEAEVENLKEKLKNVSGSGRKGKFQSNRKVNCSQGLVAVAPVPELFEATMSQVKETSKSLTSLLLSLMQSAHWNIAAAVQSIESAANPAKGDESTTSTIGTHHARSALESYICTKMFEGFDHETFYIDGSLSSLLNPDKYRRDCFTQFRDMNSMDPAELLGISPTCPFGQFCCKKYLSVIHPKMEESLFGNLEQNKFVSAGNHPRTDFYGKFLKVAKAIWLLHLLAFSLDPSPALFLATKGSEYQLEYMESIVRMSGRGMPIGQIVGIPVSPGFKLGNGSIIKARVYLVPKK